MHTGREIALLVGHKSCVWSIAMNAEDKVLVSGSSDNTIKIWNLEHIIK